MAKEDTLMVHEIYTSIQGESSFAGLPCTFIRLTGCNLRCAWCDTPQAFYGGTRMGRQDVLKQALAPEAPLVEVTGGEPLLQPGVIPLTTELCDAGRTVLIETSGERDISVLDPRVHRIVDFKAPASGEDHRNRWENVDALTDLDEVKFVIADRADYDWTRRVISEHNLNHRAGQVLLSCVHNTVGAHQVVQWMLEDKLPARFQLQMHKYIWSPSATGV